jgi:hypothetical protein
MSATKYGQWRYLFAQQVPLTAALNSSIETFAQLAERLSPQPTEAKIA